MSIYEKLALIQSELKAPKAQRNDFGKYNYRNCEDILEALKPLLLKHKCTLYISDSLERIGERYYIKASVILKDFEGDGEISNTSFAREEESKKGMDGSQVTGACSSYARKYALNGLFAIDDTKDSDFTNSLSEKKPLSNADHARKVDEQRQHIQEMACEYVNNNADKLKSLYQKACGADDIIHVAENQLDSLETTLKSLLEKRKSNGK